MIYHGEASGDSNGPSSGAGPSSTARRRPELAIEAPSGSSSSPDPAGRGTGPVGEFAVPLK
ncbi:hypothetical protein [Actinomadura sp. NTSP31]|uniref:hypothetical protein n=1 Tax=Actinomadura sp. NTSP31 TaxID=1735447 RepID=UPI0035BEF00B